MFSYSRRVKSPEWRWQRRRADLRHFEIFRHGPIIIYTRLPAGGAYYLIYMFPASCECLIGISDAFWLRVSIILPTCSLYPQQKRAYSALHPQAWTYIYRSIPESSYRVQSPGFPKIVYSAAFSGGAGGGAQSRMRKAKQLPLKKISHKISYKQSKKKCKQQVFHSCRNNNKIMIKVPMQHKILPRETILSACMYTHTHRHLHKQAYWLYKKKAEGFLFLILYVVCFGRTMLYMCIEYHI